MNEYSLSKLRINYHLHVLLSWSALILVALSVNPHKLLAAAAFFASVWWGTRMDHHAVNFKHKYWDAANTLSYRVWGDY
jgi:hypothetical protein